MKLILRRMANYAKINTILLERTVWSRNEEDAMTTDMMTYKCDVHAT